MEWGRSPEERPRQGLEAQHSYETEWDMVNAVSFKKRTFSNGDGGYWGFKKYPKMYNQYMIQISASSRFVATLYFLRLQNVNSFH